MTRTQIVDLYYDGLMTYNEMKSALEDIGEKEYHAARLEYERWQSLS